MLMYSIMVRVLTLKLQTFQCHYRKSKPFVCNALITLVP